MDWRRGYGSEIVVYHVNPMTWADGDPVDGVASVDVSSESKGLVQSGSIKMDVERGVTFDEGYYRAVMYATQDGVRERVPIATMLCNAASSDDTHAMSSISVTARSVLYPASSNKLESGSYAPAGVDGIQFVADMLRRCINAPVETVGSFTLVDPVVFNLGSSVLDACWMVLDAGEATITIDGSGTVTVMTLPTEPALLLDDASTSLLHNQVTSDTDTSDVCNRFIAYQDGETAIATDTDPNSPTSYPNRGYWVDQFDSAPKRINGETLDSYARRMLALSMASDVTRTYKREYWPTVTPSALVRASVASVGLVGDMRVERQKLSYKHGIIVEETARLERSWR